MLPELLQAGYLSIEEPRELQDILKKYVGKDNVFCVTHNSTQGAGDYWWFNEPKKYINYPNIPLSKRVEETVLSIMRRRISVKYDDIVAEIFKNFPNGLTPDPRGIKKTVEKYAVPVSGKWKLQEDVIKEATKHTQIIYSLAKLGKKNSYKIFIGKREQSERYQDNHILRELNDVSDMNEIMGKKFKKERIDRINMIDAIWINENDIQCIFEVENSTNFTMALQRASNLDCSVKKFMVIPEDREAELRAVKDPIFINLFAEYNWKYLTYNQVMRMVTSKSVDFSTIEEISKTLED